MAMLGANGTAGSGSRDGDGVRTRTFVFWFLLSGEDCRPLLSTETLRLPSFADSVPRSSKLWGGTVQL